jgi:hypothetical protein
MSGSPGMILFGSKNPEKFGFVMVIGTLSSSIFPPLYEEGTILLTQSEMILVVGFWIKRILVII